MKFKKLNSMDVGEHIPKNSNGTINVFHQDTYHMGTQIGTNVVILHESFPKQICNYIIIVDPFTGERVKVTFREK